MYYLSFMVTDCHEFDYDDVTVKPLYKIMIICAISSCPSSWPFKMLILQYIVAVNECSLMAINSGLTWAKFVTCFCESEMERPPVFTYN